MLDLETHDQPDPIEVGELLEDSLPPAPVYHRGSMSAYELSETLSRTRCRGCGFWKNEWNMSAHGYCALCNNNGLG